MLQVFTIFLFSLCSACAIFQHFGTLDKYEVINSELKTAGNQDDVMSLIGDLINRTQPQSVGIILDSIHDEHFHKLFGSLDGKIIYRMSIKDSEAFEDESVQPMLMTMKQQNCELYIVIITNGIQSANFFRFTDYHRLLNTKANIITLHDYRLFTSNLLYIWKRIVNVLFIRKCDMEHGQWFELSTVPFPARIKEIFVSKIVNYWTPSKRYRWKKKMFDQKSNRHLNGEVLNVVVLEHTPTVFKSSSNESIDYVGLEIDLVKTLSPIMNFTINFYESPDADMERWGRKFGDGNFSGLLGEMDNARADIALGDLHYTMFHLDVMDLSIPYNSECLTFITPEVLSDNSWKTLLLPFSLGMW
jgi:hypothetical protein